MEKSSRKAAFSDRREKCISGYKYSRCYFQIKKGHVNLVTKEQKKDS